MKISYCMITAAALTLSSSAAMAGRTKTLLCRGPLTTEYQSSDSYNDRTKKWSSSVGVRLHFKRATRPVGLGQDLAPGECGWAGEAMDPSKNPEILNYIGKADVQTRITTLPGGRQVKETRYFLDQMSRGSSVLLSVRVPYGNTIKKVTTLITYDRPNLVEKYKFRSR